MFNEVYFGNFFYILECLLLWMLIVTLNVESKIYDVQYI